MVFDLNKTAREENDSNDSDDANGYNENKVNDGLVIEDEKLYYLIKRYE